MWPELCRCPLLIRSLTFGWVSNGSGSELVSGSGSWTIDDSLLFDGFNDYKLDISDFEFNWT
jgi:hypothetical protein